MVWQQNGLPQGSILTPVLFVISTKYLPIYNDRKKKLPEFNSQVKELSQTKAMTPSALKQISEYHMIN